MREAGLCLGPLRMMSLDESQHIISMIIFYQINMSIKQFTAIYNEGQILTFGWVTVVFL